MTSGHDPHEHDHDQDHDHGHDPAHGRSHGGLLGHAHAHGAQAPRAVMSAMGVTIVFMLLELVGGYIANSLALVSDGAHMLTDVGALLLTLFVLWLTRRPASDQMTFGYHRAEILGALVSGLAIWVIAGLLIYEAIRRMAAPPEVNGPVVFVVATVGFVANLVSMRLLSHAQHDNLNVRAAYLHMLSDLLGSLGAAIAGAILWWTHWRPIDPIITVLFSGLMLVNSWSLVKESIRILMESTPSSVDAARVREDLRAVPGVKEIHDLHIWTVSSNRLALSVHLIATETGSDLLNRVNQLLEERHGIRHTTIQVEHPDHFRSDRCYECLPSETTSFDRT